MAQKPIEGRGDVKYTAEIGTMKLLLSNESSSFQFGIDSTGCGKSIKKEVY
jgi:hypothetical protein